LVATETKTVNLYEGMFLVDSNKFANDPDGTASTILALLEKSEGEIVAHRPWQDGKLAYPIENQSTRRPSGQREAADA